ncbi:uncharacterized protein AMSG_03620 [Thecamonas trahens ATCC 50062]|uniref:Uncharacterized protein n=1 Tax=Thecamonas trahens ATCC 50062 TaxID=461836 RepID=A0A0L0D551_THETB|nr:hypothetical protein AMSG_03620 [Thecamonas trahens ATCC 50062]KNC47191.1 hypothetical protein AMSG_03620 [Thecamonas trahens ATCC 50062]|eukprot:XP_013759962.1 hypothetical protein AMSG_03620 [Thecamonas trahens ATCC 50062]
MTQPTQLVTHMGQLSPLSQLSAKLSALQDPPLRGASAVVPSHPLPSTSASFAPRPRPASTSSLRRLSMGATPPDSQAALSGEAGSARAGRTTSALLVELAPSHDVADSLLFMREQMVALGKRMQRLEDAVASLSSTASCHRRGDDDVDQESSGSSTRGGSDDDDDGSGRRAPELANDDDPIAAQHTHALKRRIELIIRKHHSEVGR